MSHPSNLVNTLTTSDNRYLALYKETISFEDGFVPSIFTKQDKISSLEVTTGGSDGNYAIKATVTITENAVYSYALVYEAGTPRIMTLGSTGISSWKKSMLTLKLSSGRAA